MTIYKHELRETFKSTMIWSVSVALFLMMYILVYPAFQDQIGSMNDIVKNMGNFTEAFGLNESSMSTAFGFYAVEAGLVLSIGGAMFAATSGISMVAKEEANHSADFLFSAPHSRTSVLLQKLAALLSYVVLFELVCFGGTVLAFALIKETLPMKDLLTFLTGQLWLHLEVAVVSFSLSTLTRRVMAGLGIGVNLSLYFLTLFSNVAEKAAFIKYISPFSYAKSQVILPEYGLEWGLMALGGLYAGVALAAGLLYFNKKDLAV